MLERLRFLERTPAGADETANALARRLNAFIAVSSAVAVFGAVRNLVFGYQVALYALVGAVAGALALRAWALRGAGGGRVRPAAHVILVLVYVAFVVSTTTPPWPQYRLAGVAFRIPLSAATPGVWLLVLVPTVAALLLGRAAAIAWAAVVFATDVVLLVQGMVGEHPASMRVLAVNVFLNQTALLVTSLAFALFSARVAARHAAELAEARDVAMEASRQKSEFLANMSHEIRTPMNGVLGMTEILLQSDLSTTQRDLVGALRSSGDTLLTIINDILDFSKIEAGMLPIESVPFSLRRAVEDVGALFAESAHSKGVALVCDVASDVPDGVLGDPTRFRQVLSNLVGNAVKFTSSGEVLVRVRASGGPEAGGDGRVSMRAEVSDTGIGIPPDRLADLFKAFVQADASTTRRFGGTGLGLSICQRLVVLMGGEIGVHSVDGEGSTFWFELPLPPAEADAGAAVTAPHPALRGRRVLVVDANDSHRGVVAERLRVWGTEVVEAGSCKVGNGGARPDLVVLCPPLGGGVTTCGPGACDDGVPVVVLATAGGRETRACHGDVRISVARPARETQLHDSVVFALTGEAPSARVIEAAEPLQGSLRGVRVLAVDDNPVNRRIAVAFLERLGCHAESATNGLEALELVAEPGRRFDVVLMDCQMPVMDGYAATRELRSREREACLEPTPVIALTAGALDIDIARSRECGMDGHLTKPYTLERLHAALAPWSGWSGAGQRETPGGGA